jgi:hypothetical protein
MKKALLLSGLLLAGCAGSYHENHDIIIRSLSADYSMSPHTYNILLSKIKTDNELYDNIITSESMPELLDNILKKADKNNNYHISRYEAKCLDDVWIEEF